LKKLQTESALPYGIQINSKGVPFFCELGTNKMGKIDPATMGITEYKLPEGARPRRLAISADDKIYLRTSRVEIWGCSIPRPAP